MKFEIKWISSQINYYKYGSFLEFRGTKVYFENELIPPGTAIVSWKSDVNYAQDRIFRQLPLLERGGTYRLKLNVQTLPEYSILIKINFYNRLGNSEGVEVLSHNGGTFIYPQNAFSYEISLVCVGTKNLFFEEFYLCKEI